MHAEVTSRDLTFIESHILSRTEDHHDWVPPTKSKVLVETLMTQANKKGFKLIQKKKRKRAAPSCRLAETEPDSKVNFQAIQRCLVVKALFAHPELGSQPPSWQLTTACNSSSKGPKHPFLACEGTHTPVAPTHTYT